MQESIKFTNFYLSAIQEKHSEVLIKTAATISCVVTGLTKQLNTVKWEKPNSGGVITDGTEEYHIDIGTYQEGSYSQTTILTVPAAANKADATFSCVIKAAEYEELNTKTAVRSNVFSEYTHHMLQSSYYLPRDDVIPVK